MKKMALVMAAAFCMLSTVPAFAQDMTQSEKDECLLASRNCVSQVDDIYARIHKLDAEIKKGTRVYTPQELKQLQLKLQETDNMLRKMEEAGGS
jgi:peptidoglycan hydrolase CwlO-like protein